MKKIVNLLLFIVIMLSVTACSSDEFMNTAMQSWVGYSLDDVIKQWGYPKDEKTFGGKKLLYWPNNTAIYIPQTYSTNVNYYVNTAYTNTTSYGGGYQNFYCNRILEVDKNNKIIGYQWEGNNCPTRYAGKYKKWVNFNNNNFNKEVENKGNITKEQKTELLKLYNQDKLTKEEKALISKIVK